MKDGEKQAIRSAFLSKLEPPDELKRLFQEEVDLLLRRKLTAWGKIVRAVLITVFGLGAIWFGYAAFFIAIHKDPGLSEGIRIGMAVIWVLGALLFLAGVAGCIVELKAGRIAPRRLQEGMVHISRAFVLVFAALAFVYRSKVNLPPAEAAWAGAIILFFWIMAEVNRLSFEGRWNREDIILEHKRTQLAIAALGEEMLKRTSVAGDNAPRDSDG